MTSVSRIGKYRTDVSDVCPSSAARAHDTTPLSSASWKHVWKQMWPGGSLREQLFWLLASSLL